MTRPLQALAALICCGIAAQAFTARADGPALWEVAGRGNKVYLFGSVHLLRTGEFRLEGALERAYEDAEAVYLEVDMDDLSPTDLASATAALAIDPDGRSLDEMMGPCAAAAHERAAGAGIDLSIVAALEPWFAALTVVTLSLAKEGYTAGAGVERRVLERAAADGKPILGLETVEEQLSALDSMALPVQREFLLKSLEDAARPDDSLADFLAAWREGDEPALARELETEFDSSPELYRSLMVDRNRRWAVQIEDLLDDQQDYLVVVGALHLVGPDGLPAMLAAHGRRVTRR
jgi:uncharacterized protein YbaP (TraB family)